MNKHNHILDKQLPLTQNFEELKNEGLSFIQKFGSKEWSNLNQGDPGVTILDQLCYAMTELGYCGEFPIEDILTQSNGKINFDSQFYLPGDILTTSPVTVDDYRKVIVDNFKEVINVLIEPAKQNDNDCKRYNVYLYVDNLMSRPEFNEFATPSFYEDLRLKVYILLNRFRNLGELFSVPEVLVSVPILLEGTINLDSKDKFQYKIIEILKEVEEYIFCDVKQHGYNKLVKDGLEANEFINGPKLDKGWVASHFLKDKKDTLSHHEIEHIVSRQEGVQRHSGFKFIKDQSFKNHSSMGKFLNNLIESNSWIDDAERLNKVTVARDKLIKLNIIESINKGTLKFFWKDVDLKATHYKNGMPNYLGISLHEKTGELYEVSSVSLYPELPKGKHREIDDYYSIQNTFPEVYSVGVNAMKAFKSEFEIAQSRQLRGYLTLFDQVLANQFAQLSNVPNLFNFKNSIVEDPFEENLLGLNKIDIEKYFTRYPVEYLGFSPTYFYQSLYNVENIRPVLKGHNAYKFEDKKEDAVKKEKKSWKEYKDDAYNPYINGLNKFMEDEEINMKRRNDILNHLLARHGESWRLIDELIDGSEYIGEKDKDKIIFKSLYLQNLGLISYYRMKGNDFIEADRISSYFHDVKENEDEVAIANRKKLEKKVKKEIKKIKQSSHTQNFIFNSPYVDKMQKMKHRDFDNFSAIELKLNLFLGLSVQYLNFIKDKEYESKEKPSADFLKQALWLLKERKGMIMVETNVFQGFATFFVEIINYKGLKPIKVEKWLDIHQLMKLKAIIHEEEFQNKKNDDESNVSLNNEPNEKGIFNIDNLKSLLSFWNVPLEFVEPESELGLEKEEDEAGNTPQFIKVLDVKYGLNENVLSVENDMPDVYFFFPRYIPQFKSEAFQNRVDLFLSENLPINNTYKAVYLPFREMNELSDKFLNFHNCLVRDKTNSTTPRVIEDYAKELADFLPSTHEFEAMI